MQPADFFKTEQDSAWSINGDPWSSFREVLDTELMGEIAKGPIERADDLDVANALTQLVHDQLRGYGTDSSHRLNDSEIASAIRALALLLHRLNITFKLPFRDFRGFHDYWCREGMSGPGGWGARRGYLSHVFEPVWDRLRELEESNTSNGPMRGVDGQLRNIIFASTGPKPEIVLRDAVNNNIEIVKFAEHCLIYDRPLTEAGLTWGDLVSWWGDLHGASTTAASGANGAHDLYRRLYLPLGQNSFEQLVFRTYCERYRGDSGSTAPALIPQVYLHLDPFTARERRELGKPGRLKRERMDFLLLLPNRVRIVIEVDGKQHYADGEAASPARYAEMVAEDRALRLRGYEVFRFGGYELAQTGAPAMVRRFFDDLLSAYSPVD
ncbi:hypothetical protein [Nocardia farcinica]|uniref:hypothetical protein n=1 Tax=Nocardia farcinica TaxID=37329 RepID=UPI001C0ED0AA|nr:hypothetical protein [Nocardia farcinica]